MLWLEEPAQHKYALQQTAAGQIHLKLFALKFESLTKIQIILQQMFSIVGLLGLRPCVLLRNWKLAFLSQIHWFLNLIILFGLHFLSFLAVITKNKKLQKFIRKASERQNNQLSGNSQRGSGSRVSDTQANYLQAVTCYKSLNSLSLRLVFIYRIMVQSTPARRLKFSL